ncbi:TPA: hypothetical protein ACWWUK_004520 [Citrobacter youngae]
MGTESPIDYNGFFPEDICIKVIAELNSWTNIHSIASAARIIEKRCVDDDEPSTHLIMPVDERLNFDWVFTKVLHWFIQGYEPPVNKILFSRALDSEIKDGTLEKLKALRFKPTVTSRRLQDSNGDIKKCIVIEDKPEVIDLVSFPLTALMDVLVMAFDASWSGYEIRKWSHQKTGGSPTIYHSPYADSRLFSMIEALCFAALGMEVGVNYGRGKIQISKDYRSVNVQARPPFDKEFITIALKSL